MPDAALELQLEDNRFAKRRRSAQRHVANAMLDPLPTPTPTPMPTFMDVDSHSKVSDEPNPRIFDTSSQSGITRNIIASLSNTNDENSDDGAHTKGTVEILLQSPEKSLTSHQREQGKEFRECNYNKVWENHKDEQLEAVFSRSSAGTPQQTQQTQNSNRSATKKRRDLFQHSRDRQDESMMATRTSRDATSSKPTITSVNRSWSTPSISPKVRVSNRATGDCRSSTDMACQIADISHYDVPKGSSIIMATVHYQESSSAFDVQGLYRTVFGDEGKALRMVQLSRDSWMLLGY